MRPARDPSPLADWLDAVYGPFVRGVGELWTRALDPRSWPRLDRRREDRCGECGEPRDRCDPCACEVCDADLAVLAYPGELRVFPITVENTRSHERTITAEISGWVSSRGDRAEWPTRVTPHRFTLGPCAERTIAVRAHLVELDEKDDKTERHERAELVEAAAVRTPPLASALAAPQPVRPTPAPAPAVPAGCVVYYADLRLAGCELRPLRLAVALLPESCGAHHARCGCGCCA
jgi:hypothetical protein